MRLISAVREVLVSVRGLTVEPFKVFGQHSLDAPFLAPGDQSVQGAGHVRVRGGQGSDSVAKLTRRARLATTCWTSTRLVFVACLLYAQDNVAARPMVVMRRLRSRLVSAVATLGGPQGCPFVGRMGRAPAVPTCGGRV